MAEFGSDWRAVDGAVTAWFDAPSLIEGAALAGRVVDLSPGAAVDLRSTGVRVRLAADDDAEAVSEAARDLGLGADLDALQQVAIVIESANPSAVQGFWRRALDYVPTEGGDLVDPLQRDPTVRLRRSDERRPLRHRIHVDVLRPAAAVELTGLGDGSGPYGVRHSDPDGNEIDLVPGDPLGETAGTADWHTVFSTMACFRVASAAQQRDLAGAVARLAVDAGFPLLVDLRPGWVIVDSGKDMADPDAHALDVDFPELATSIQSAAHDLGATADAGSPRFVQVFLDAADVAAVRAFWIAALGYVPDRRPEVTDIVDPRRLNPEFVFQRLDASDADRRRQRNRIHVELAVPADLAPARVAVALAAGGTLLDASGGRWRVADPEGNEIVVVSGRE